MKLNSREEIIALTPLWTGERFPDGRPKVPRKYLDQMRSMTLEELWKPIFVKGYESQFEGDLRTLHDDGRKLIGRAVTTTFVPTRPDLHEVMFGIGKEEGRKGNYNVFGAGGGVLFIPAHLVKEVVEGAAKTLVKDDFGFEMISKNIFTTAQIDRATWTEEMLDLLTEWIRTDPRGEKYRDLDWSQEYDLAGNGDPNDTQTML